MGAVKLAMKIAAPAIAGKSVPCLEKISVFEKCQACKVGVSSHGLSGDGVLPSGDI